MDQWIPTRNEFEILKKPWQARPLNQRRSGKVRFSLKDHLFNREKTEYLGELFAANDSEFSKKAFVSSVMKKLPALELKQRIVLIAEVLESHLPDHFPAAVERMMGSLPPPLDESKTDDDFGDFIFAPLGEFVVRTV